MAVEGVRKPVKEEGCQDEKPGFVVTFTNGALEQLESLQEFIGAPDPLDVIKVGISLIQGAKEESDKKNTK